MPNTITETPKINITSEWGQLARTFMQGNVRPPHSHTQGQLLYTMKGFMLVETNQKKWVVPPQRALWIPPKMIHSFTMFSQVELRTVYFEPNLINQYKTLQKWKSVNIVKVTPLFKQLITSIFTENHYRPTYNLMARLLLQILNEIKTEATFSTLPMPLDPRLYKAAQYLLISKNWNLSIHHLATLAAMSERTFSRQFSKDTGFNLRTWKQIARIYVSLDLLSKGVSIKQVTYQLNFSCPSSFSAAFQAVMGRKPQDFKQ